MKNLRVVFSFFLILLHFEFQGCLSPQLKNRNAQRQALHDLPIIDLIDGSAKPKIPDRLSRALREAPSDKMFKVLFDFKEQLDLVKFTKRLRINNVSKRSRREEVIRALNALSQEKERSIQPLIETLMENESIEYYKKFSIVNRFYVVGNAQAIVELADRDDVARVIEEYSSASARAGTQFQKVTHMDAQQGPIGDNWALKMMGAESAWKNGYDGRGVIIGLLDSGVWLDHEQLKDNFRGGTDSWFDPVTGSNTPFDSKGHGTGVLSCAVGANVNKNNVGIAQGAQWIAALANYKNYYNNIFMTYCADWMLNVGKPDVIINAWSHGNVQCEAFDLDFINAWKAAEIFPVFAAGNQGPAEGSSESPADLLATCPKRTPVFSVGSINEKKEVSSFSSRGPSRCSSEIFPTVVAPGEDVFFAFPIKTDSYIRYSGTSSSAGYAAGTIAIVIQKYPEMSVDEIENLIRLNANDCGEKGPDNQNGYGLLSIPSLLKMQ